MAVQNSSYNANWLEAIVRFAETSCRQRWLNEDFPSKRYLLNGDLNLIGLPSVPGGDYLPVWEAIVEEAERFVEAASDRQEAAGALLWRFLKSQHNVNEADDRKRNSAQVRYQQQMVTLLNAMKLPLSAKDKINALAFLDYKYTSEDYRVLYKTLGNFEIGENPETVAYEKEQSVRLFYAIFDNAKKSTWKNKVSSVAVLLETIARNSRYLDYASYGGQMIDKEARTKMQKIMKKSKVSVSLRCQSYFSPEYKPEETNVDVYMETLEKRGNGAAGVYIGAILRKAQMIRDEGCRKSLLEMSFPKIHSMITKENATSDKLIDNYSTYLSLYAACFPDEEVAVDALEKMLVQNSEQKNIRRKEECLFPELLQAEELPHYDKKDVAQIVENYSLSLEQEAGFNPCFNQEMRKLLQRVVILDSYAKEEVRELCDILRGTDGNEHGAQTAKELMSHYTSCGFIENWRVPRRF